MPSSQFWVVTPTAATVAACRMYGSDWASEPPPEVRAGVLRSICNLHRGCFHVTHNVFHQVVIAVSTEVHAIASRNGPEVVKSSVAVQSVTLQESRTLHLLRPRPETNFFSVFLRPITSANMVLAWSGSPTLVLWSFCLQQPAKRYRGSGGITMQTDILQTVSSGTVLSSVFPV
jgi:hypothetical protein